MIASLDFAIDYFCATIHVGGLKQAFSLLEGVELESTEKGLYGYKASFKAPGFMVLYTPGRPDVHVQITGEGCRELGDEELIRRFSLNDDIQVSRIDLRCDVFNGPLSPDDFWGFLHSGCYASPISSIQLVTGADSKGYKGTTVYLGSPKSEVRLRCYDKRAELGIRDGNNKAQVRFEYQTRGVAARLTFASIKEQGVEMTYRGLNASKLRLLVSRNESRHAERIATSPAWESIWAKETLRLRTTEKPRHAHIASMLRYIKGTARTLKALKIALPDFQTFLEGITQEATLQDKHKCVVKQILDREHELDVLSENFQMAAARIR